MRGPGYRNDLDVRRTWRCPQCAKQRRVSGDVTTLSCVCGAAMQLVEPLRRGKYEPQPLVSRELTVASFELTEEELSRPVVQRSRPEPDPSHAEASDAGPPQRGNRKLRRGQPPRQSNQPVPPPSPEGAAAGEEGFGEGIETSPQ